MTVTTAAATVGGKQHCVGVHRKSDQVSLSNLHRNLAQPSTSGMHEERHAHQQAAGRGSANGVRSTGCDILNGLVDVIVTAAAAGRGCDVGREGTRTGGRKLERMG